jgi:hypothetical protein
MHKTLKDFLAAKLVDETDKLAQRALKIHVACIGGLGIHGLIANAHERGDGEAYTQMCHAHYEASIAFVACNLVKNYAFAAEVLAQLAVQTVDTDQPAAVAAYFVGKAETTVEDYAERCAPVTRISGVKGVRILRGEHALHAMRGVHVANAA